MPDEREIGFEQAGTDYVSARIWMLAIVMVVIFVVFAVFDRLHYFRNISWAKAIQVRDPTRTFTER
jgi:hypothetical protein